MRDVGLPSVAVTGLGAVTPLGGTAAELWEGLLAERSGARLLTEPWAESLPVRLAAPAAIDPAERLDRVQARRLDRSSQLALVAAREAWDDAGRPDVAPERIAVVIGTGVGGITALLASYEAMSAKGPRGVGPLSVPMLMANGPAATLSLELSARAGVHTPVSACSSGAEAIALALDLLRLDRADVVVCGGTEAAIAALPMAGFAAMRALSTREDEPDRASRPFDKARDGFLMGEGAGVLVLERIPDARARGARVYAELAGAGITSDAHHIAAPDPTGSGAARSVTLALRDASAAPSDVHHVNAHATSTPAGDVAECAALRLAFGADVDGVAVTATKSMTGHLLGAAGAVEAIATVLSLHHRTVPVIRNLDDPDDEVALDLVRAVPRPLPAESVAVSTSFGFGGHDVALAFRSTPAAEELSA